MPERHSPVPPIQSNFETAKKRFESPVLAKICETLRNSHLFYGDDISPMLCSPVSYLRNDMTRYFQKRLKDNNKALQEATATNVQNEENECLENRKSVLEDTIAALEELAVLKEQRPELF